MPAIHRKLEIVENTFLDTVVLGYAVLYPGYTGEFDYLREDSGVIYTKGVPEDEWPTARSFCLNLYQGRTTQGRITIKYTHK